jgi:hypothetical protein
MVAVFVLNRKLVHLAITTSHQTNLIAPLVNPEHSASKVLYNALRAKQVNLQKKELPILVQIVTQGNGCIQIKLEAANVKHVAQGWYPLATSVKMQRSTMIWLFLRT